MTEDEEIIVSSFEQFEVELPSIETDQGRLVVEEEM